MPKSSVGGGSSMSTESRVRLEAGWLIRRAVEHRIGDREWVALYADLYRQTHGEAVSPEEIISDALWRLGVIGREIEERGAPTAEGGMHFNPFSGTEQWMTQERRRFLLEQWDYVQALCIEDAGYTGGSEGLDR